MNEIKGLKCGVDNCVRSFNLKTGDKIVSLTDNSKYTIGSEYTVLYVQDAAFSKWQVKMDCGDMSNGMFDYFVPLSEIVEYLPKEEIEEFDINTIMEEALTVMPGSLWETVLSTIGYKKGKS